jgi:peptide/nickel transport system ATP-binding protein
VVEDGHVVEHGATETVLTAPAHPYTQKLLADLPDLGRAASVAS